MKTIRKIRGYFSYTGKGLGLAWRASPRLGFAITGLTAVSAGLPPLLAYVGKLIVDAVVSRSVEPTAHSVELTTQRVILEFLLIATMSVVQRLLFLSRNLLGNRLGIEVNSMILAKAVQLDLAQIENSEFYDKLTRARQEASSRSLQMVTDSFQFIQNAMTLFAYVGLLLSFSTWAVLALVIASLPATWAEMRFSTLGFRLYNWRSPDRRRLAYMEYVLANDGHAKEVRVLGLAPNFLKRFRGLAEHFYKEDSTLARKRTLWVVLLSFLSSGAFYGCYLAIARQAARGEMTLGNLTLYIVVFRQGQQAFQSCLAAIGGMYEHNLYLSNLFDFLNIPISAAAVAQGKTTNKKGIFFEDVSFRYPGREVWALQGITLHIPPGESVAVVGSNGAGKSTLIKLLCRLYFPTQGTIYLDGMDLRDWDAAALLKRMGVVFQDFNKYQLSFKENVGVGQIAEMENSEKISRAIQRGGADELLLQMPAGMETPLGTWFPGGRELSGGQWQKVAVSRAFMREEADILILDEPTAAMDAEAESLAISRFHELTLGKTSLIISHRFPIARIADHILVIEDGTIKEEGTHVALLAKNGRYAQLFALQAKGYV